VSRGNPPRIVLPHRLLIIAETLGDIGNGHPALKQDAREGVPETVRGRRFFERPCEFKSSKTLLIFRRHISVTVSSRSDCPTIKGRAPQRFARATCRSRNTLTFP